jgi:hypothetical protein
VKVNKSTLKIKALFLPKERKIKEKKEKRKKKRKKENND